MDTIDVAVVVDAYLVLWLVTDDFGDLLFGEFVHACLQFILRLFYIIMQS